MKRTKSQQAMAGHASGRPVAGRESSQPGDQVEAPALRLTQFSPGAGCGCKISARDLDAILHSEIQRHLEPRLLVGNESRDDAAVFDLGNGQALVSTTDFFTPIVDDPREFGRIAGINAISDVFAMGGRPLFAVAILGWPLARLTATTAAQVVEGGRDACAQVGIPLAGGHSIDIADPIFGLAVTGIVATSRIRRNDTATVGCRLLLTKPLGTGIVTTAQKRQLVRPEDLALAVQWMTTPNDLGPLFAEIPEVRAMTDVTGFGLLGHLREMAEGSGLGAIVHLSSVPVLACARSNASQGCVPGGTKRNLSGLAEVIAFEPSPSDAGDWPAQILCDPQTSGGLLLAVEPEGVEAVRAVAQGRGLDLQPFGELVAWQGGPRIRVLTG